MLHWNLLFANKTNTITIALKKLRSCVRFVATQNVERSTRDEPNEKIVIPKRINRSSTDILEALAKTVSRDVTASHYKYHDDPFLIPISSRTKRAYALSKESGRKAARWIFTNYPQLFEIVDADPKIESFMPSRVYDEKSDVTELDLQDCIEKRLVSTANKIFNTLKSKDVSVSAELQQSLLELNCFYNSEDEPNTQDLEEKWFRQNTSVDKKPRKTWNDGGTAEQLFNKMDPKTPEAYCALIRGMAKYLQVDRAYSLYQEMQEKQMFTDVYTYNALIPLSTLLRDSFDLKWQLCEELLTNMNREGVVPNLGTFNSVLEVLSKVASWRNTKKLALETMGEMKEIGIEPSLASYNYLLNIFCRERGPSSTILYDIMNEIETKELEIRDPRDVNFFATAMTVCHMHLMDKDIALKLDNLLNKENNYALIGNSMKESTYYYHLFKLMCFTETLDNFFNFYNNYAPMVYTPEPSVMLEILQAIDMGSGWKYIPQVWTDIVLFEQWPREALLQKLLSLLASSKPDGELQQQFADIAYDIKEKLDSQKTDKLRKVTSWTGEMIGNVLQTCLNAEKFDRAWEVMKKCQADFSNIVGLVDGKVLYNFLLACAKHQDIEKAMFCLRYISDAGLSDASYAELMLTKFQLSQHEKSRVHHLVGSLEGKTQDFDKHKQESVD